MLGKKKKGKDDHGAEAASADAAPAEGEAAVEGGEAKKKGLPIKLIAIGAAGLLVVGGGGGAAAFILLKPKHPPAAVADAHAKPKKKEKAAGHGEAGAKPEEGMGKVSEGPEGVTYYAMPSVLSDMQGSDGRPAQIKLGMTFELADEEAAEAINENMPRVKDMLQTFLRELRPEDLGGSEGSFRLRQEMMRRVNLIIEPDKIKTINLTEIVIS